MPHGLVNSYLVNLSTESYTTLHAKACRNGRQDGYHYAEHGAPNAFFLIFHKLKY